MFVNDVSYLYSDEFFSLSSQNKIESSEKLSETFECRTVRPWTCRVPTQKLEIGHRTKHVILFRDEAILRDKLRKKKQVMHLPLQEKHQLFQENLYEKIQELLNEQSQLERHSMKIQSLKKDFKTTTNHTLSENSCTDLIVMNKEKPPILLDPYSKHFNLINLPITKIRNVAHSMDYTIASS